MAERINARLEAMSIAFSLLVYPRYKIADNVTNLGFLEYFRDSRGMLKDTIQKVKIYDNVTVGPRSVGKS